MKKKVIIVSLALAAFVGCTIEPPLHLPAQEVVVDVPMVETRMEIVWQTDVNLAAEWHYGWDSLDVEHWGVLDYPEPTNFEIRRYFLGPEAGGPHTTVDHHTIYGKSFRASYEFGYYDMLLWSNIDSKDGTQVLIIDERLDSVKATTSSTRGYRLPQSRAVVGLYNQPEIFYAAYPRDIYISRNFEDYDRYDSINRVYIKHVDALLNPRVYIYLVQVVLHNNDGRVRGITGDASMTGLASSTSVNTGHTGKTPANIYFDMRIKPDIDYKGEQVDIVGGKFTTFGLCDMPAYTESRGARYNGGLPDQTNNLYVSLAFSNGTDSAYAFSVTDQLQSQAHGGVVTVHVNVPDLTVPQPPNQGGGRGSGFVPTVDDYDEVIYEFNM